MSNPLNPYEVNALFKPAAKSSEITAVPAPPSPEELKTIDDMAKDLPNLLWGGKKKDDPAPPPAAPPAEPPKTPAAATPPPDPAAPPAAPDPKPKRTKKPQADPVEIARAVGESIASKLATPPPAAPATTTEDDVVKTMSDDDKYNYEVMLEMSQSDSKYKDTPKEFLGYVKEFNKYKDRWENAHPGEEFDMEGEEHADFFAKHEPDFNDADFRRAETRMEYKKIHGKERQEMEERIRKAELKATLPQVHLEADKKSSQVVSSYQLEVLPKDGNAPIDLVKLKESDPLTHDIIVAHGKRLGELVGEIHKIAQLGADYFNSSNPLHQNIVQFIGEHERQIKSLPITQQVFEGKMFASIGEYTRMNQTEQAKHWTLEEDDFVDLAGNYFKRLTQETVNAEKERLKLFAERYGYTPKSTQNGNSSSSNTHVPPAKPQAPSGGGGGPLPPTSGTPPAEVKDLPKALVSSLFGK